ncbi:MAG TPA: Hsp20/alpha crystallin family protein [Flavisolibacter sp.]|nr:Hsp20/alpha crystallin family protein [Flavisolibacter sp.]
MTLVRFNNRPVAKSFNNLVDDFFTGIPSLLRDDFGGSSAKPSIPVNIKETEQDFVLELFAPGLNKEDFRINLENNVLTVSAEHKAETENANEKSITKEYRYQSFSRSFNLDEKIDADNIAAKYVNGVLTLNLPKKTEVKEASKQISIQ